MSTRDPVLWFNQTLEGTGATALAARHPATLVHGDEVFVGERTTDSSWWNLWYDEDCTDAHDSPNIIRPNSDVGGAWRNRSSPFGIFSNYVKVTASAPMENDIRNLRIERTGATTLTVQACSMLDSTGIVQIYLTGSDTVAPPAATTSQPGYVYAVKLTDGTYDIKAYDDTTDVASDADVSYYRLISEWPIDGSGNWLEGVQTGNLLKFANADEPSLGTLTTSFATVDHSEFIGGSNTLAVTYGCYDAGGTQGQIVSSIDGGTNIEAFLGMGATVSSPTSVDAWGSMTYTSFQELPWKSDREFKTMANNGGLLLNSVRMKL